MPNGKCFRGRWVIGMWLTVPVAFALAVVSCAPADTKDTDDKKSADGAGQSALKKVQVETVARMEIVDRRSYTADLEASTEVTLYPLLAERIVSFPVEEGDRVVAGQVIARIRAAGIKKSIAQMQAEIESLDETIGSQKRELERSLGLYEKAVITQQTLEQMESGYKSTLARRKSLEASLGQIEVTAGNAILKSPVDGFVIGKQLEEGDIAQPVIPLCRIIGVDPIRVNVGIIEKDLMAVRVGMDVALEVGAVPNHVFRGKIVRILPVVDRATRSSEARIDIANPKDAQLGEPLLKPGMFGRVSIVVATKPDTLAAPAQSLMVGTSVSTDVRKVFVVDNLDIAHERSVKIGVQNGEWVEIQSGLQAAERVVTRGQYSLKDGDKVRVYSDDKGTLDTAEAAQ
ncbi:MAG: efflux RND transporter periplasmic adaptor subunit [Deltaproteobacteria bacterium]|nr:efflux RND transporter periplasmic adaptor subunit [Deltaproteobacteria bacterium]